MIIKSRVGEAGNVSDDGEPGEPEFPVVDLAELEKKISHERWIVPVLPEQELERLLIASIKLSRKGLDTRSEPCQRFFRESLTFSFTKILTDDAVSSWKRYVHLNIYHNCKLLVELCVFKLPHDCFPLLDLLAILFNPSNKFHTLNNSRDPIYTASEDKQFARPPPDSIAPRGWLIELINRFGELDGFTRLRERFLNGPVLNVSTIYAHLRPFVLCCEFLTVRTIADYLLPVINQTMEVLHSLTDEELRKEAKNENKNDAIASIIEGAKSLVSRVPGQDETFKQLEILGVKLCSVCRTESKEQNKLC